MNEYILSILFGIIEGLTEFLPVSSTAHIRISQQLLNVDLEDAYWKMFAIVIQLGAILSVVVYFRKRIIDFLKTYPHGTPQSHPPSAIEGQVQSHGQTLEEQEAAIHAPPTTTRRGWFTHPVALVMIAFVVTALPCYLIDKWIGQNLESLPIMGWALVIGGVLMWGIDWHFSQRARTMAVERMTLLQAVVIGLMQIFAAAFPGTSRSMATIAGGQIMGLSRPAALEFSFFLSIPVMVAATGYKLLQFVIEAPLTMTAHHWVVLGIGFGVSFVVALACIAWFMAWVRKRGFVPFAIYRIILGIGVLAWAMTA